MAAGQEPSDEGPSSSAAWSGYDDERVEHEPWLAVYRDDLAANRSARHGGLASRPGYDLHPASFVADSAHVVASRFSIGEYSFVAAGCVIRGEVAIGDHVSLNAGAVTIGRVTIGDGARIASYAVLVGENHVFTDPDTPIAFQGLTSQGVIIEDDVWIGANVTVVDGVTVGAHSVIAAGAVVTKDVAPYSVVAGVPARQISDRRTGRAPPRKEPLDRFDAMVSAQWRDTLERCQIRHEGAPTYADVPDGEWAPRPLNDAIEIAGMFGEVPPIADRAELIARIRAMQDPDTGLFIDPRLGPPVDRLAASSREWDMYGLLSCGYALEVLGAGPTHPVHVIEQCAPEELERRLDGLDMGPLAWGSGAWIDGFGTGLHLNRAHHGSTNTAPMLWGWLLSHQHRHTGMWGTHLDPLGTYDFRWLMAVNGFYRLTRGTYAQWGVDVAHPEAAIDTVLAHCRDWHWFSERARTACNVLDVVHPLWLLSRQVDHRRVEIRDAVAELLVGVLADWRDGAGFAFEAGGPPGLQGTEMWLSIVYFAADLLDESAGLSFRPRGVHRLEPASSLS